MIPVSSPGRPARPHWAPVRETERQVPHAGGREGLGSWPSSGLPETLRRGSNIGGLVKIQTQFFPVMPFPPQFNPTCGPVEI